MRIVLRVVIAGLILAVAGIAAVPLFVLRDLNRGGSGWGLCPDGLDDCSTSYFTGFELIAWLALALVFVFVMLRIATRTLRFVEHQYDRNRAALGGVGADRSDSAAVEPSLLTATDSRESSR